MASGQHHEHLQDMPPPLPSERSTGIVFATVFLIFTLLLRHHAAAAIATGVVSFAFLTLALVRPQTLAPLNRAWFKLALLLNRFVSPVVMFVIYAVVIVPAGLVMQRLRDPLQRDAHNLRASYWIDRTSGLPPTTMRDQF